jgi:hypothetical protein
MLLFSYSSGTSRQLPLGATSTDRHVRFGSMLLKKALVIIGES